MKNPEQTTERQFIENFFANGGENFFSDTNEYLIHVLEQQYKVDTVEELPEDFNETIEFSKKISIVTFTPKDICEGCVDYSELPEDNEDFYVEQIHEVLKKHIDFDKLNAEIPKLYYPTGEKMQITKADLIEWDN